MFLSLIRFIGSFSKVYLGEHLLVDIKVAIKVMEDLSGTEEVESLSKMSHQNITELYEYIEDLNVHAIVMEFVDGEELYSRLERGKLCESEAKYLFYQLCLALDHCHRQGVAHRDVKLENILVTKDNQVKLCDFGLSTPITGQLLEDFCGSVCYTAPEILKFNPYDGRKSDVWSLGIVLFSMLTGYLPFSLDSGGSCASITDRDRTTRLHILEGVYHIPDYVKGDSSDLILRALSPVGTRISVTEILNHPWFRDASVPSPFPAVSIDYCIERLVAAGLSRDKLKRAYLAGTPDSINGLLRCVCQRNSPTLPTEK